MSAEKQIPDNYQSRVIGLFLLMLLFHVAHVFEEVWGEFRAISIIGSLAGFLLLNWFLLAVPFAVFYFTLRGRRWAHIVGIVYAALMAVNGAAHLLGWLLFFDYRGGVAGAVSGIGLLLVGPTLAHYLYRRMRNVYG